ncbi:MAG: formate hydrogenlyase [Desulfuromonas sp.]|uniref:respiratory chain complex I subunit 1 family protein n=1 Tax=Desulfuromonas sp. TaxID=892 RepID=UPI000CC90CBF|nr:NADH-quinone oxidoreductase subunit H [Desulfuromonas sp.]PLX83751.1 MAG: formate hydrogenlyase [Desulfuromonas sp.]
MNGWLLAIVQTGLLTLGAPLLAGWVKWIKCKLQCRQGPPPWQPYRDLARLFRKDVVLSEQASPVFRLSPYLVFSVTALAGSVVPMVAVGLPTSAIADVIVLVGFFALTRFFLALAGMDVGTAFGGMGSSREVTISSLAEPAMLMGVFTLAMTVSSTNLATMISHLLLSPFQLYPSFIFAAMGLVLVTVAETGRIPVDNPATHLELTMIHEAMILEYSGRHLALMEWAAMIKLMIYGVLIANLFVPWGIALQQTPAALATGLAAVTLKLLFLGAALAVAETILAKMRLFRVPQFLGLAFILCLLGMLSHVILEVR